jgi:hypothetical protein
MKCDRQDIDPYIYTVDLGPMGSKETAIEGKTISVQDAQNSVLH